MDFNVMERNEKTKLINIGNSNESVIVLLRYVEHKPETQATYLEYRGVKYDRWREQGSFIQLLNRCIGTEFRDKYGDRKILLNSLYEEKFELIKQFEASRTFW